MSPAHSQWLALVIGNSRLHWALFSDRQLVFTWHTPHLPPNTSSQVPSPQRRRADRRNLTVSTQSLNPEFWRFAPDGVTARLAPLDSPLPLWVASVVQSQLALWMTYPALQVIERDYVPLENLYPSLGIDRILALLGAGMTYGWPVLVIDGGTALTFTAGHDHTFLGGAILPGLSLQVRSLSSGTDALPPVDLPQKMPPRWANNTVEAIQSGILYTQLAGIWDYVADWQHLFPSGRTVFTGGDGEQLLQLLQQGKSCIGKDLPFRDTSQSFCYDPNLVFLGIAAYRQATNR